MLIPCFTVGDNIVLAQSRTRNPFLDKRLVYKKIGELSEKYGLQIAPRATVAQLSMGERQRVDILKALCRDARVLILDEPTSVLTPVETERLMSMLKGMAAGEQVSIIFVTHKLPQVMAISDRVTILQKGKVVDVLDTSSTNEFELAKRMVGREVIFQLPKEDCATGETVLQVTNLHVANSRGVPAVKGVSLCVRQGEILGIAGVAGNGQRELVEVIAGLRKAAAGEVLIGGRSAVNCSPREVRDRGVAYVPGDRIGRGTLGEFSVEENLILGSHSQLPFRSKPVWPFRTGWFLNRGAIANNALRQIDRFAIKTSGRCCQTRFLSGGNTQKLILARELSRGTSLIVCEEPTQGLDVGATEYVRRRLLEERGEGKAILLVSSDLDEVMSMSDRLAVMFDGQIAGTLQGAEINDIVVVGQLMTGVARRVDSHAGS